MKKSKKIIIIVSAVVVGLGLVIGCIGLYLLGFDFRKLETSKLQTRSVELAEDFTALDLDMQTADLIVLPAQDGKAKVVCREREKQPHTVFVKDGVLRVQVENNRKWYDYIGFHFGEQTVTVYLPKTEYAKMTVEMTTGDIRVPKEFSFDEATVTTNTGDVAWSASVAKNLTILTDTGDIELSAFTSEAAIKLKTDTGDMELLDITCNTLGITTDTGDIELTGSSCVNLAVASDTGEVDLERVTVVESLQITTNTGDVEIENSDAATIKIQTDTGDVSGLLLSDKIFFTQTDTGDVDVPKTTSGGVCEVVTDTGDIYFRIKR